MKLCGFDVCCLPNKARKHPAAKYRADDIPGHGIVRFRLPKRFCFSGCCLAITTLFTVLVICSAALAIFFSLLVHGKSPHFQLYNVSFSHTYTVTMTVNNPRDHVRVSLGHEHSRMSLSYNGEVLGQGVFPGLDLSPMSPLSAHEASLARTPVWGMPDLAVFKELANDEAQGGVPLTLDIRAPVKFKIGLIKTWAYVSKIHCDFTVDRFLTGKPTMIKSQPCHYDVSLSKM